MNTPKENAIGVFLDDDDEARQLLAFLHELGWRVVKLDLWEKGGVLRGTADGRNLEELDTWTIDEELQ